MRDGMRDETSGCVRQAARERSIARVVDDLAHLRVDEMDQHLRRRGQPVPFPVKLGDARPVPGHRFGALVRARGGEVLTVECVVQGSRVRPSRAGAVSYRVFPSLIASTAL